MIESINIKIHEKTESFSPTIALVNTLPEELFCKIFSLLAKKDLQSCMLVNKTLRDCVNISVNHEISAIRSFIKIFEERTKESLDISETEEQKNNPSNFFHLEFATNKVLTTKNQSINSIKNLTEKDANDLKDRVTTFYSTPNFIIEFFKVADFKRQVDKVHLLADEDEKNSILKGMAENLMCSGYVEEAQSIASLDSLTLQKISQILVKKGNPQDAVSVINLIECDSIRYDCLFGSSNV